MTEPFYDTAAGPLPQAWLPDASPAEGSAEWLHTRAAVLARLEGGESTPTWPAVLASWWKPAAVAATTAAVLLLVTPAVRSSTTATQTLPLNVLAAGGEPVALWQGAGIEADPVLALITVAEPAPGGAEER